MHSLQHDAADRRTDVPLVLDDTDIAALSVAIGVPVGHFDRAGAGRRLASLSPGGVRDLAQRAERDPRLRARARRAVVNSQTGMFRDRHQFDLLREAILPRLLASERRLTAWSAGCSDGSELVSLALTLRDLGGPERGLLLGSDLLAENLAGARGLAADHGVRGLRWEQRDIVEQGPPRGAWRLVICRNVAIHLTAPARARLHDAVTAALARDGVLLLGRAERLADAADRGLVRVAPNTYARCP